MTILSIDLDTWAKIGSTVGGFGTILAAIGTWVAAFLAFRVAKQLSLQNEKIAQKQIDQTKYQHKIALYDKRYEVYVCFIKYFNFISSKEDINETKNISRQYDIITDFVFSHSSILQHSDISKKKSPPLTVITDTIVTKHMKDAISKHEMQSEDFNLRNQIINTIALSEFCFSEEISTALNNFIEKLFIFIAIYKFPRVSAVNYIGIENNFHVLLESIKNIEDENIVQKMKDELKLAYKDTQP